jgi:hypothetical protein
MKPSHVDRLPTDACRSLSERFGTARGTWFGKERAGVNRFVMGHLVPLCVAGQHVLEDPARIGVGSESAAG